MKVVQCPDSSPTLPPFPDMTDSPHYEFYGTLLFAVLSVLPLAVPIVLGLRCFRACRQGDSRKAIRKLVWGCAFAAIVYVLVVVDAFLIEPNWPRLRTIEIKGRLKSELKVLHLSDLHLEKEMAPRDRWLVEMVERLSPDIIFITGDIHQVGNDDVASLERVLRHMKAPLGVFACVGYDNLAILRLANPDIVYLVDNTAVVQHNSDMIAIAGSPRSRLQELRHLFAKSSYGIVLEHTPDWTDTAAAVSADLYLCGHTHGGQVRIPFWGAITTKSRTGKKYEAGLYSAGDMFIHTSRGLGMYPPRVRFFCRPEITLIRIVPRM